MIIFVFAQAILRVGSQGAQEGEKQGEANANSLGGTLWKSGRVQSFLFQVALTLLTSGREHRGTGSLNQGKVKQAELS